MEEKIIQYINQDLYQETSAKDFDEFQYNMEGDASFNDIKEVYSNLNDLKSSHEKVATAIEGLCDGVYSEKTEVCNELRNFGKLIGVHLNDIETTLNDMTEALKTVLEEQVASDEELIDDLQKISELLGDDFDASKYSSASGSAISGSSTGVSQDTTPASETTPEPTATTGTVEAQTAMTGPEPQEVKTVTQNPEPAPQPASTGGAVTGTLSPGTTANTFQAQAYNLSPDEYKAYCATIYAEAAEGNSYMVSDTMGVASTILNRVEAGNWGGNSVTDVISASGQFSGYGYQNQKFAAAMNDPSIIPAEMRAAIDRTLAGERNTTGQSFSGNGTHNSFR